MTLPSGEEAKLITVIVPQGQGRRLLEALYERKELKASLSTARAPVTTVKRRGGLTRTSHHSVEKDIVSVVVAASEAASLFEFLYERAGIGTRHGGFMFQGSVANASPFTLPPGVPHA